MPQLPFRLRLWLAGYHTPSLNVTKGGHWKQYYGLKQAAAGALLAAVQGLQGEASELPPVAMTNAAAAVLVGIAMGGRARVGSRSPNQAAKVKGNQALLKAFGPKVGTGGGLKSPSTFKRAAGAAKTLLRYTRVTCQPLDMENVCGSTKALTDCLRYAFPGVLPDDAPEFVTIEHTQVRCGKRCEEGTWVELSAGGEGNPGKDEL